MLIGFAAVLSVMVGFTVSRWLSGPVAVAIGSTLAAALFGLVSGRGTSVLEKRAQHRDELPGHVATVAPSGRLRRVREFDDPVSLRIHPAAALVADRDAGELDRVPPYVPRDVHARLTDVVKRGGFVLVVGESTAGKSRAAYEAMRASIPDHVLIAPVARESLSSVVPTVAEQRRCVVWLDDLERFLGAGGITAGLVSRMVDYPARNILILATLRTAEFDRFSLREEPSLSSSERESWHVARDVLQLAEVVDMQRRWTRAELDRANAFADDPRISAALRQTAQFGLAEVLAAGPQLAREWHNAWRPGAHPRAASLIAAAVDCRRAGMHEPVAIELLRELSEMYLTRRGGALLRPEPIDDAIAWATSASHGASSLLLPTGSDGYYLAFDYLIDLPELDSVPLSTWETIVKHATPEQAHHIGEAAQLRDQPDAAVLAYRKAADHAVEHAEESWACAIGSSGDHACAARIMAKLLERSAAQLGPEHVDTLHLRRHHARHAWLAGDLPKAAERFRQLVEHYSASLGNNNPDTLEERYWHARCIAEMGDFSSAQRLFDELHADQVQELGAEHPHTLATLQQVATSIGHHGDAAEALQLAVDLLPRREKVFGSADPRTLRTRHLVAEFTGRSGDPGRAAELFQQLADDRARILGAEHKVTLLTRLQFVRYTALAGDRDTAADVFNLLLDERQQALGNSSAATIAEDLVLNFGMRAPVHTRLGRQDLSESLELCEQLLGPDHHITVAAERIVRQARVVD
ncbi:tetratricopeptide repeat protein [Amycolatopsis sp. NPDC004747]